MTTPNVVFLFDVDNTLEVQDARKNLIDRRE